MQTDFSVFRERLAEACRARNMTQDQLCSSIDLGSRRAIDLELSGLKSLSIERLCQIADRLEVSVDWLVGRSNVMSVMEMPELPGSTRAD
jgi:transcriptional regulator with XRE-family HTH domain